VQVYPIMKPKLNPPGIKRLRLIHDDPLSNFASNFNLRRYKEDPSGSYDVAAQFPEKLRELQRLWMEVRRCREADFGFRYIASRAER